MSAAQRVILIQCMGQRRKVINETNVYEICITIALLNDNSAICTQNTYTLKLTTVPSRHHVV